MGAALTLVQHLETPSERVDGFVDAIGRGRERRQEVEAVSDRANEEASLERLAVERETIARDVGARSSGAWVHEIARGDRAKAAGVPNRRVGRKARPGGAEPLREVLCMFEYGRLIEEREARGHERDDERPESGERVGAIRTAGLEESLGHVRGGVTCEGSGQSLNLSLIPMCTIATLCARAHGTI